MNSRATGIERYLNNGVLVPITATVALLVLAVRLPWSSSEAALTVVGFGALLFVLLFVISASHEGQALGSAKTHLRPALVVWWSLLVSEQAFFRHTPQAESFAGHFSPAAYGEAAFWALASFALFLIMPVSPYLRHAFSGSNKWLSGFAVVCLVSAPLSPTPLYSVAWVFKLLLVVLLLLLCSAAMHDLDGIEAFFWANLWGFVIVTVVPVAHAFANPSTAFEGGRLNESTNPTMLSLWAGTLVLLALTLNSLRKRTYLLGFALLGATVMIMAGGKAGIIAGIASVTLFFVLQGRVAAGFGWVLGVFVLACIILVATPLATYFTAYHESGGLSTLTGRTDLWTAVWPEVLQHPIVGHGFVASRFVGQTVSGVRWEAGHMHNGFLEALYNNGLIGLIILVGIHVVIVKNLWRTLKGPPNRKVRLVAIGNGATRINLLKSPPNRKVRLLAVGSCAIYVNLLISGLIEATFGGAATPSFMLLLSLIVVSEALRRNPQPQALWRLVSPVLGECPFRLVDH